MRFYQDRQYKPVKLESAKAIPVVHQQFMQATHYSRASAKYISFLCFRNSSFKIEVAFAYERPRKKLFEITYAITNNLKRFPEYWRIFSRPYLPKIS